MKKIILILWVTFLTQFTFANANNDLFSSCSEQEITQEKAQSLINNNDEEIQKIKDNLMTNDLVESDNSNIPHWEILRHETRMIWNSEYKTDELMFADNWSYAFISVYNNIYYIVKDWKLIKSFKDDYSNLWMYKPEPNIFLTKDWKHFAYSYKDNNKYCISVDSKDTCYESWNQDYYFYPQNISFSDDWSKVMYSMLTWQQWEDWIHYRDEIYINNKKVKNSSVNGYKWFDDNINSDYSIWWGIIKDLFFSPNWENYVFTIVDSSNVSKESPTPVLFIYKNWDLINKDLSYMQYNLVFSLDSKDFYYSWFRISDNKELFFKNNEQISYIPSITKWGKWLDFFVKYSWRNNVWDSYFTYNDNEYKSDYITIANLKNDWKSASFLWIKSNQKIYNVSCILNADLNQNTKVETKTAYTLTSKETNAIKVIWGKINKMNAVKKNKYINQLNIYATKFKEWTKNYEIVKQLLEIIK